MKTAALYARVSSVAQDVDLSIAAQLRGLRDYAAKHGYTVVREFVDEAESGRTSQRPVFQDMIAMSKRKPSPFQDILVWKLSRFARNREDSIIYKSLLRKHGVQVVSINEPVENSPTGKMLEGMIEVIDEFYSANLAQEVTRGMREAASRGFWVSSGTPFAYRRIKVKDGIAERVKLEPVPENATVVKRIFDMALTGMGVVEITKRLNALGIASPNGKRWGKASVHNVLVNPAYIGTLLWGIGGTYHRLAGLKPVRVENAFPPIIERKDFEAVQTQMRLRAPKVTSPQTIGSQYLLSGLLKCGICKTAMTGHVAKSGAYRYYVCSTQLRLGRDLCKSKAVRKDNIEGFVIDRIRDRILEPKNVRRLVRLVNKELAVLRSDVQSRTKVIYDQLNELSSRLDRLYTAVETGSLDMTDIAPRIKELTERRSTLEKNAADIGSLARGDDGDNLREDDVLRYVGNLGSVLDKGSIGERKELLRSFVISVEKSRDSVTVKHTTPAPPGATEEEVLTLVQGGGPAWNRTKDLGLIRTAL